jgi:hypothetical protein
MRICLYVSDYRKIIQSIDAIERWSIYRKRLFERQSTIPSRVRAQFLYGIFDKTYSEIALSLQSSSRFKKSTNFQESNYKLLIYNALQRKLSALPPLCPIMNTFAHFGQKSSKSDKKIIFIGSPK